MNKQAIIDAGREENRALRRNIADLKHRHDRAINALAQLAREMGNLLRGLKRAGWPVIGTDIATGHDALTYAPAVFDCIIGNPPFSIKDEFLARCYSLGRPFALLMPATVFDSDRRRELMRRHGFQLLLPDGRIHFETPNHAARAEQGLRLSSWFYSIWVTWQLDLPADLTFA